MCTTTETTKIQCLSTVSFVEFVLSLILKSDRYEKSQKKKETTLCDASFLALSNDHIDVHQKQMTAEEVEVDHEGVVPEKKAASSVGDITADGDSDNEDDYSPVLTSFDDHFTLASASNMVRSRHLKHSARI